ncbi:MAG TPA: ABC transporter ATP-binding protein, partial [Vicinamibacterales bacterium]|nr:ABC transporter ATP-binding protein [Vicinamibacterales bacterium]
MSALATRDLTKDYAVGFWRKRPYRALDHLSIEVNAGEVFGFLGPNGAGKTTTLKLLMQLVYPTSGHAEMLGRPVGDLAVKRRIGYLPENPYFYDHLTAEELLVYFAALFGYAPAERRARASRLLDEVGIGAERRLQLRKFSKGML